MRALGRAAELMAEQRPRLAPLLVEAVGLLSKASPEDLRQHLQSKGESYSSSSITDALARLVAGGELRKVERGRYALPEPESGPSPEAAGSPPEPPAIKPPDWLGEDFKVVRNLLAKKVSEAVEQETAGLVAWMDDEAHQAIVKAIAEVTTDVVPSKGTQLRRLLLHAADQLDICIEADRQAKYESQRVPSRYLAAMVQGATVLRTVAIYVTDDEAPSA